MVSSAPKDMGWAISLLLAVAVFGLAAAPAAAQNGDAEAPQTGAMDLPTAEVPADLQQAFDQMVHYYRIALLDNAAGYAQQILGANPDPLALLAMVEHEDVGYSMIAEMAASDNDNLAEAARKILDIADKGIYEKRKDGDRILDQLHRLAKNERAYQLALRELKYSGEYVVPYALGLLQNTDTPPGLVASINRALIEIDRPVVLPLVTALETENENLKLAIIDLLGKLGYRMAVPGLKATIESPESSDDLVAAATEAIRAIRPDALNVAADQLYYDLSEDFYYERVDPAKGVDRQMVDVWGYIAGEGLAYRPAPRQIVNEIYAGRAALDGLQTDAEALELVSLWMTTQMQLRAELTTSDAEQGNPWAPEDMPTTEAWAGMIGQQYLMDVLDRAMRDERVLVAIQAINALERVANARFLHGTMQTVSPLVEALEYPDRMVRFGAAFVIVEVQPKDEFFGADRVVPVLAEAVGLETGRSVLIADSDQENLNRLQGEFRQQGWNVATAGTGNAAVSAARGMARLDAVLLASNVQNVPYTEVVQLLRSDFSMAMTPIIVLSGETESVPFSYIADRVKYVAKVDAGATAPALIEQIDTLQSEAGSVALGEGVSQQVALRAARALGFVATADLAFSAEPARESLLVAAAGKNDQLAIAAMDALVQMPDAQIQQRLAEIALADATSKDVRVAALESVAQMARHIGNKLQSATVTDLMNRVGTETDSDVREAIGTVLGALDLEPRRASTLLLEHAAQ